MVGIWSVKDIRQELGREIRIYCRNVNLEKSRPNFEIGGGGRDVSGWKEASISLFAFSQYFLVNEIASLSPKHAAE